MSKLPAVPRAVYYMGITQSLNTLIFYLTNKKQSDVEEFSTELKQKLGVTNLHLVSHARIALLYILKTLPQNSNVMMTPINIPDMLNSIKISGHNIRFIDYSGTDFSINIEKLKENVSHDVQNVFFLTILNGILPLNYQEIIEYCKDNKILLIQDTTQAFGLQYNGSSVVNYGNYSLFSLCDLKDVHTHRGGVIAYNGEENHSLLSDIDKNKSPIHLKYLLRILVEDMIGCTLLNRTIFRFMLNPVLRVLYYLNLEEELVKFSKGLGFKIFGVVLFKGLFGGSGDSKLEKFPTEYFFEYVECFATIGRKRLLMVDDIIARRVSNAQYFRTHITQKTIAGDGHTYWKFPVLFEDVEKAQKYLLSKNIDAARTNLPNLAGESLYKISGSETVCEVAEKIQNNILYIPVHYYLMKSEVSLMVEHVNIALANDKNSSI